jgi:hypothetical protein
MRPRKFVVTLLVSTARLRPAFEQEPELSHSHIGFMGNGPLSLTRLSNGAALIAFVGWFRRCTRRVPGIWS